jgi:hypothetical protein
MRSLESTQVARRHRATTGALWTAIHVSYYIRPGAGSQRDPASPRESLLNCLCRYAIQRLLRLTDFSQTPAAIQHQFGA